MSGRTREDGAPGARASTATASGGGADPTLAGRAIVRRGGFALDVELALGAGERLAVIGPNGSGKSTLLAGIAGLAELSPESTLELGGRALRGTRIEDRGIGFLAQDGLLFPHLRVLDNVAFGPRSAGARRPDARACALELLREVQAEHLADARPATLSGGERQRVALARALATDPGLLVLDEPFAALDVDATVQVRELIAAQVEARGLSLLLVTHDLVDALRLAERALVLERGRVVESLGTRDLARAPAGRFAASFAGLARLTGTIEAGCFATGTGVRIPLRGAGGDGVGPGPGSGAESGSAAEPGTGSEAGLGHGVDSGPRRGPVAEPGLEPGDAALLLVRPDEVRLEEAAGEEDRDRAGMAVGVPGIPGTPGATGVSEARAGAPGAEDRVESLVGDGSAVLARLESGLLARVPADAAPASGTPVRVSVLGGRIRPAAPEPDERLSS
ncbi:sulfate/molybdate ABC transporter ATP-binding protein [Gulosibacter sp. 10]|uniref:sulfate/molybdate ABC transporter ATP-binding protein n=1 Tax=Gulosibacter sp. 10 TaxID=1255570 RepID=UPI00097EE4ED|nr:ATP-binding cassette domain-containing protein [Gulosibacter sp. 10]SJM71009.1 Molybdenum transport ATP-binding protein ModC (TC 3.A.1.8.1) [Gulosibacter sp. 10]